MVKRNIMQVHYPKKVNKKRAEPFELTLKQSYFDAQYPRR